MKVLHINVRLSEGGAAGVARELHLASANFGIESYFAYGYSRKGKRSPEHDLIPNVIKIADPFVAAGNLISHRVMGVDFFNPSKARLAILEGAIRRADVVHLHAVHSHMFRYSWLFGLLNSLEKNVIWTAHDHWAITGRCAFLEGCEGWKTGCGSCVTKNNYPKSKFDISSSQFRVKHRLINSIRDRCIMVSPSLHLSKDLKACYPEFRVKVIPNSVDTDFAVNFQLSDEGSSVVGETDERIILVIANDLSYEGKTDSSVVNDVARIPGVKVITVGSRSPFSAPNIKNIGTVSSRYEIANIMRQSSAMLFTSKVDNCPLVIGEAHYCGLPVLATPSPASDELLGIVGGKSLVLDEILRAVESGEMFLHYGKNVDRQVLQARSRKMLGVDAMMQSYLEVYREVVSTERVGCL